MAWKFDDVPTQNGRLAVVTGGNIGLGFETALALAAKGCTVVLACRNLDKAAAAKAKIVALHPAAKIGCMALDLSRQKSVHAFAAEFSQKYRKLDLLINNAGIMMPPHSITEDGFESQFATNYLGHFTLTGLLLPLLEKAPEARVVSLSSLAHRWSEIRFHDINFEGGYNDREAYGQSKLACLMFAYELNRRLQKTDSKVMSVAAHPGIAATNLFQNFPKLAKAFAPLLSIVFQSAQKGALPTLCAALGEHIGGGDYVGPKSARETRGAPGRVGSNRRSNDEVVAAHLWTMSEEITGVHFLTKPLVKVDLMGWHIRMPVAITA